MKGASERLLELIDNLLELTTLKRGPLEVTVEEFDPRLALDEAIAATPGRPGDVLLRIDEPTSVVPVIRSDRRRVVKIIASLLGNAYKFTPRGEAVWISARDDDRVLVYDTATLAQTAALPVDGPSGIFFTSRGGRVGF